MTPAKSIEEVMNNFKKEHRELYNEDYIINSNTNQEDDDFIKYIESIASKKIINVNGRDIVLYSLSN